MCTDSGVLDMKSKMRFGSWRKVTGSGLSAWITSGNLIASRMKNTGRLLPTRSQLPSSVRNLTAKPRGSRAASEESRPPMTVENRIVTGVLVPLRWNSLARVYVLASSSPMVPYASNSPCATKPRACRLFLILGLGLEDGALAVEVADLLEEVVVLQRGGPAAADRALLLVVVDRVPLARGQHGLVRHVVPLVSSSSSRRPPPHRVFWN